jgi:hypothetical protein
VEHAEAGRCRRRARPREDEARGLRQLNALGAFAASPLSKPRKPHSRCVQPVLSHRRSPVAWSLLLRSRPATCCCSSPRRTATTTTAGAVLPRRRAAPSLGVRRPAGADAAARAILGVAVAIAIVVVLVAIIARELGAGRTGQCGRSALGRCVRGRDGGRTSPLDDDLRPTLLGDARSTS